MLQITYSDRIKSHSILHINQNIRDTITRINLAIRFFSRTPCIAEHFLVIGINRFVIIESEIPGSAGAQRRLVRHYASAIITRLISATTIQLIKIRSIHT